MPIVRNWREQDPVVGHVSALIWALFRPAGMENANPPELAQLRGMSGFVRHGLQGRQHSDYHQHANIEQMYYVLKGHGQLLLGEEKRDVQEGDAVYIPATVPHQAFNDGDFWMEHLIVSCPLDEATEGTPIVRNWRDTNPAIGEQRAVVWDLLSPAGDVSPENGGVLQQMHSVTRQAVQGRQATTFHQLDGIEQVYYVLSGRGIIATEESQQALTEGSAVYVAPGVAHRIVNEGDAWIEYVIFAADVDEEEHEEAVDEALNEAEDEILDSTLEEAPVFEEYPEESVLVVSENKGE